MLSLSIIVPFYNVEPYIEVCVRSSYVQDIPWDDYEVICVDDCSPDGSKTVVERLQDEFPTLRLVCHERNKKLGGARNTGIRVARGKYILFLDSDDMLRPNCLKNLIREIDSQQDDYIHFNYQKFYNDGSMDEELSFNIDNIQTTGVELFFSNALAWQHQISACRRIYRKDFLLSNNLFFVEDIMYEDNDFSMRVAAAANKCRHLDVSPYLYRQNQESVTKASVSPSRLIYWQKTWPIIVALLGTIGKQDIRFVDLIHFYIRYDLWDVLNNLYNIPRDQRKMVKQNLSMSEWLHYISFLPFKRRLEYIYKLVKA